MPKSVRRTISDINSAISPAHLRAIGQVAASWSRSEIQVVISISRMSEVPLKTVITLIKPSGFINWLDMLVSVTEENPKFSWKAKRISKFVKKAEALYPQRNGIVHAYWMDDLDPPYTLAKVLMAMKPKKVAEGFSIPKRGKKNYKPVTKSASEMRSVATKIRAAEQELRKILNQPFPGRRSKLSALAQLAAYTQSQNVTTPQTQPVPLSGLFALGKKPQ